MKVAVTGANGFLGSHIVRYLSRHNIKVTSLVRLSSETKFIDNAKSDIVKIDYNNEESIKQALLGIDILVHNAARAKDWGSYKDFYNVNVKLTKSLYKASLKANIKRIIHISSNAVLGEEDEIIAKDEKSKYAPVLPYFLEKKFPSSMNYYRKTKAIAEKYAIDFAKKNDIDLIVLRPVWIFGPREFHAGPFEYCQTLKSGLPLFPGNNDNLFHCVYVKDVAKAIFKAIESNKDGVNIYMIGNKNIPKMSEFFGKFCKQLGVKKPFNAPKFALYPFVLTLELIYLLLKMKNPPVLTRARLYMFYANNVYDVTKAKDELSFEADIDFEKAIATTVRWWKANKYL